MSGYSEEELAFMSLSKPEQRQYLKDKGIITSGINLGIKAFKRANAHLGKDLNKAVRMYKEGIWHRVKEESIKRKEELLGLSVNSEDEKNGK